MAWKKFVDGLLVRRLITAFHLQRGESSGLSARKRVNALALF